VKDHIVLHHLHKYDFHLVDQLNRLYGLVLQIGIPMIANKAVKPVQLINKVEIIFMQMVKNNMVFHCENFYLI
jgi:hypothetical protein